MTSPSSVISFRSHLVQAIADFLTEEGWINPALPEAATELVTSLGRYREEGKRLLPVAFFTKNLEDLLLDLNGQDPIPIGVCPLTPQGMRRALKQCAPLGEGRSWVIYLLIKGNVFEYGVFRRAGSQVQPTALEQLRRLTHLRSPVIGVVQLAENVIEIRASAGHYKYLYLSGLTGEGAPPMKTTRDFIDAITRDVSPELRDSVANFYYRVVMDVMQVWHGTLVVVLPRETAIPPFLSDGILLEKPIDIQERIRGGSNPLAESNLIRGMMGADGITILSSEGTVLGYNVFLQHPIGSDDAPPEGGARRRTYNLLKQRVGRELVAAFYRSQDGTASCHSSL